MIETTQYPAPLGREYAPPWDAFGAVVFSGGPGTTGDRYDEWLDSTPKQRSVLELFDRQIAFSRGPHR